MSWNERNTVSGMEPQELSWHERNAVLRSWNNYRMGATMDNPRRMDDWMAENGYRTERDWLPGRIGRGTKVHRLMVTKVVREDGSWMVWNAHDMCGSSRWNFGAGYSGLTVLPKGTPITCKKCGAD